MALVLLVEDNFDNRFIYCTILEHRGYTVREALDGAEGVRMAQELLPDVILLDIAMPVMNGWEAIHLLKSHPLTKHIPVIALTAHALSEDENRARELGFDQFIRKPVEPVDVVRAVEAFLRIEEEKS